MKKKIDELKSINALANNDRYFKVGDVIRFVGRGEVELTKKKGVGVVVEARGPIFKVYWVGAHRTSVADARVGAFNLQDCSPLPEIADWVKRNDI